MEAFSGEAWGKQALHLIPVHLSALFPLFAVFGLQHAILLLADWAGHQNLSELLWGTRWASPNMD
jgi:hypothetical protein